MTAYGPTKPDYSDCHHISMWRLPRGQTLHSGTRWKLKFGNAAYNDQPNVFHEGFHWLIATENIPANTVIIKEPAVACMISSGQIDAEFIERYGKAKLAAEIDILSPALYGVRHFRRLHPNAKLDEQVAVNMFFANAIAKRFKMLNYTVLAHYASFLNEHHGNPNCEWSLVFEEKVTQDGVEYTPYSVVKSRCFIRKGDVLSTTYAVAENTPKNPHCICPPCLAGRK